MHYHDLGDWLEERPRRELLVAPRYLAGPVQHDGVIERLDQDRGWARESDTAGGDYLASPCRRVQIAHRPERGLTFSWQISAADRPLGPARWEALFDEGIPDETVHAFLDTLAQDVDDGHDRFLTGATLPGIAYGPLLAAGWEPAVGDRPGVLGNGPRVITAPQDTAQLVHRGHLPEHSRIAPGHHYHWEIRGGDPDWEPTWRAAFAGAVLTHLIAAVTTELADPRPVARTADQLPSQNWVLLRVMPTEWLPAPRVSTAAQARTTTLPAPHPPTTRDQERPVRPDTAAVGRRSLTTTGIRPAGSTDGPNTLTRSLLPIPGCAVTPPDEKSDESRSENDIDQQPRVEAEGYMEDHEEPEYREGEPVLVEKTL